VKLSSLHRVAGSYWILWGGRLQKSPEKEPSASGEQAEDIGGLRPPLFVSALLSLFWERGTGEVSNRNILIGVTFGSSQPSADYIYTYIYIFFFGVA